MRRLKELSATNLLQVFTIVTIFSLATIVWSLWNMYQVNLVIQDMRREAHELRDIEEVEVFLLVQELAEKEFLLSGDEYFLEEHDIYEAQGDEYLKDAAAMASSGRESDAVEQLADIKDDYEANFQLVVEEYNAGNPEEAAHLSMDISDEKIDLAHEQVNDMIFNSKIILQDEIETVDREIRNSILIGTGALVLLPALAVWAFIVSSQMTLPFLTLINAIVAIDGDNYRPELLDSFGNQDGGLGMLAVSLDAAAQKINRQEATLDEEIESLYEELNESKRRQLITSIPGRAFTHRAEDKS